MFVCKKTYTASTYLFFQSLTDLAEKHEVDCLSPSIVFPLVVTTFTKIPKDDQLVSGIRLKMDVDAGEWLKGSYKMWVLDTHRMLFKFPGISPEIIEWDQPEYDRARKDEDIFNEPMENQDSVQRRALSMQENAGFRYFVLKFERAIDNHIFKALDPRVNYSEMEKNEAHSELTVFQTSKPINLPGGGTFSNNKVVWRVGWIVAFEKEVIARPASPITSEMAETARWMRRFNGQFTS